MPAPLKCRLLRPTTIAEAIKTYVEGDDARYLAGGTDLIVNMRRGVAQPRTLVSLEAVAELRGVAWKDDELHIGANTTLAELIDDDHLVGPFAALAAAAREIAGPTHREVATVGGNICLDTRCIYYNQSEWWRSANNHCLKTSGTTCHVAPNGSRCVACYSGDLAPVALVLGAKAVLSGPRGSRIAALATLFRDDGKNHLTLLPGEILTTLIVPANAGATTAYEKIRIRGSLDFPLAGVAIALAREGEKVARLNIALTGTNSRPLLIDGLDDLIGRPLDVTALDKATIRQIKPMRSTFASGQYRRKVASNIVCRLALRVWEEARN
jgi:4-hydroxybenzoyl-CoA reductase subunit beta